MDETCEVKNTGCCPQFDPIPWDGKTTEWNNKQFIKDKVFTLFYMPVNFGSVISRLMGKVKIAGAESLDNICLADHTSKWNMDIFVSVTKNIEGCENINISGKYISKVYEGEYKNMKSWMSDFDKYIEDQNVKIEKQLYWYTTCPKCAKAYGKNYVVILGKIID